MKIVTLNVPLTETMCSRYISEPRAVWEVFPIFWWIYRLCPANLMQQGTIDFSSQRSLTLGKLENKTHGEIKTNNNNPHTCSKGNIGFNKKYTYLICRVRLHFPSRTNSHKNISSILAIRNANNKYSIQNYTSTNKHNVWFYSNSSWCGCWNREVMHYRRKHFPVITNWKKFETKTTPTAEFRKFFDNRKFGWFSVGLGFPGASKHSTQLSPKKWRNHVKPG